VFDGNNLVTVSKAKERADSFGKWMMTKVIDNLQIFINNVHIRYEGLLPVLVTTLISNARILQ